MPKIIGGLWFSWYAAKSDIRPQTETIYITKIYYDHEVLAKKWLKASGDFQISTFLKLFIWFQTGLEKMECIKYEVSNLNLGVFKSILKYQKGKSLISFIICS